MAALYDGVGKEHWVEEVRENGREVVLEDMTRWIISPDDRVFSENWLPQDNIAVEYNFGNSKFPYRLTNTDYEIDVEAELCTPLYKLCSQGSELVDWYIWEREMPKLFSDKAVAETCCQMLEKSYGQTSLIEVDADEIDPFVLSATKSASAQEEKCHNLTLKGILVD